MCKFSCQLPHLAVSMKFWVPSDHMCRCELASFKSLVLLLYVAGAHSGAGCDAAADAATRPDTGVGTEGSRVVDRSAVQ